MKNKVTVIVLAAAGILAAALTSEAFMKKDKNLSRDSEGHVLTSLWKAYYSAQKADQPKKMSQALGTVIEEAKAKRYHWDFYDASVKKFETESSVNWKKRSELREALSGEIAAYDEPIVTYTFKHLWGEAGLCDYILVSKARLQSGRNPEFYLSTKGEMNGLLNDFIKDDYEYALWSESGWDGSKAAGVLEDYLGDSYPSAAWFEFRKIMNGGMQGRKEAAETFAEKYNGRAVALFGKALALEDRMAELQEAKAGEDAYKALYEDIKASEKERRSFTAGVDGRIATSISSFWALQASLEAKSISISFDDGQMLVGLRNLDKVEVSLTPDLKDAKPILKTTAQNPARRFYVLDTVRVALPPCDDGDYVAKAVSGKVESQSIYSPKRLSIAVREDSQGWKFYVADHLSGEPCEAVDLKLNLSGESIVQAPGVKVDGFTPVPKEFADAMKGESYYTLEASVKGEDGFLRKSKEQYIGRRSIGRETSSEGIWCNLMTDKGAYNPGETIRFKAVLYGGDMTVGLHTLKAGEKVQARLLNAEGKETGTLSLSTNEFGSVAGEFPIQEGQRNGSFRLEILQSSTLASRTVVVDEFMLPTYDLTFEEVGELYFLGDEIEVKGRLSSYSGHPLDAADLSYTVDGGGQRIASGDLDLSSDGTFSLGFETKDNCYFYNVTVKVKDATGETKEFSKPVFVVNHFNIDLGLENAASGEVRLRPGTHSAHAVLLAGAEAVVSFTVRNNSGRQVPVAVNYSLTDSEGKVLESGVAQSGEKKSIRVPGQGIYSLNASSIVKSSSGKEFSAKNEMRLLRVDDEAPAVPSEVENFFKSIGARADGSLKDGEDIRVQMGVGTGPVWAVAELFGDRRQLLGRTLLCLGGQAGDGARVQELVFEYKKDYPDAVWLSVFYFHGGSHFTFSREFRREKEELSLPLEFSSFEDKALPGKEYSLTIKSIPGAEAVASVFDKSSETIASNFWRTVRLMDRGAEGIYYLVQDGGVTSFPNDMVIGYGVPRKGIMFKTRSAAAAPVPAMEAVSLNSMEMADVAEEGVLAMDEDAAAGDLADEVQARSDFATSLAFEPFLRTDDGGEATLKFRTSDKLSTFVVQVYAHTTGMLNSVLRREMTVSVPVKVSLAEPKYLYKGDKAVLHATVSNAGETPVTGTVSLQVYPSSDYQSSKPFSTLSRKVTVPPMETVPVEFDLDPKNYGEIGLKVTFADKGKTFSDAVFVSLPVHEAEQTLTEAHSAVLLSGMDKDALVSSLRKEFTGTTSAGAEMKEVDIRRMLLDAIPSKVEPRGKDVLSLSETFYVRKVAESLGSSSEVMMPDGDIFAKILSCRNADGGFAWFQGMRSSPVITAVVLERFAKLRDAGLDTGGFDASASVAYLDRVQFIHGEGRPYWCGWLSTEQYAFVRSMYPSVSFDVSRETANEKSEYSKNFKEFKKYVKDYLLPSAKDGRGLNGQILAKARRIRTLGNLVRSEEGKALAAAWGIKFSAESKMRSSISADIASLYEYSVDHPDGGCYYPNAVMPWRGLLESELYAHSMLCDLFSSVPELVEGPVVRQAHQPSSPVPELVEGVAGVEGPSLSIANGIRIWMMLQKETQEWDSDPAFVDAINSVLQGGEDILSTRIVSLTKTYRKPFKEIVQAGNGFTVERHFYKEVLGADSKVGRVEIYPGMRLSVGDKVTAEYRIWSQENRSFVRLTAPRVAAFRPVSQLSGHIGWWMKPIGGGYSVTPQGYRNVKTDATEYYFDVYPEENSTVTEEFFITQEGTFSAPVVSIESLYAPHYRANDKFGGQLKVNE